MLRQKSHHIFIINYRLRKEAGMNVPLTTEALLRLLVLPICRKEAAESGSLKGLILPVAVTVKVCMDIYVFINHAFFIWFFNVGQTFC